MANIIIIGAGSMGTAFSFPCANNKNNITIVGTHLENDFIDKINIEKKHPALKCKTPLGFKFVKFQSLEEEIGKNIDLIVIAVISKGIEFISIELSKFLKKKIPILILTKGLSLNNNTYEILAHKMDRILKSHGVKETDITAAGGPCLAKGLAHKVHTSVVFANKDINIANKLSKLISTDYYHISTSSDVVGVEICAAIKNIFSMVIGASQGLCIQNSSYEVKKENYLNTAAALMQESIYEMITFTEKLKGKKETVMGLAGIGDLYVSADGGRNSKMGEFLGQGYTFKDAKKTKMLNETVEGADLAFEIGSKIKEDFNKKDLPLMISMIDTICDDKPLKINWQLFNS